MNRYRITAAAIIAAALTTITPTATAGDAHREWDACAYEDGSSQDRCIWHARRQGNGEGHSLKIINGGEDDARYIRITHRFASHLLDNH